MQDVDVNWIAIIVAAIVPMVLGALWYSPMLFAEPWMRAVGRTHEELGDASLGYLLSAVGAFLTSYVLARIMRWAEVDDPGTAPSSASWCGSASSPPCSP
jgi:hypothetical protein